MTSSPFKKDTAIAVCLFVCTGMLYYWTLPWWWISSDDPVLLAFAAKYSFWEYTFNPNVWKKLTASNLTPWVLALYDLDLALFGLSAHAHYMHNMFSAACLAGIAYITMRLNIRPWLAALGTIAFCLTPVFASLVHDLMSRHYLEGLIWALLAILSFRHAFVKEKTWASLAAGACFLIAVLHKEIYAPLIAFFLFWPTVAIHPTWQLRAKAILPSLTIAALYPIYRFWMLGVWIGGYGSLHQSSYGLFEALEHIVAHMWPNAPLIMIILFPLACFSLVLTSKLSVFSSMSAMALILGTSLPLSQVLPVLSMRHLLLPVFLLFLGAFLALDRIWTARKGWSNVLVVASLLCVFSALALEQGSQRRAIQYKTDLATIQGRFLWEEAGHDDVLLVQGLPSWYIHGLQELALAVQNRSLKGNPIFDFCSYAYTSSLNEKSNIYRYNTHDRRMLQVDKNLVLNMEKECMQDYRQGASLFGRLQQDSGQVRWKFGPYTEGSYSLVSAKTGSTYPLPHQGKVPGRIQDLLQGPLHLCYAHPDGWHTCKRLMQKDNAFETENRE